MESVKEMSNGYSFFSYLVFSATKYIWVNFLISVSKREYGLLRLEYF
jgi:hypothetical protein